MVMPNLVVLVSATHSYGLLRNLSSKVRDIGKMLL